MKYDFAYTLLKKFYSTKRIAHLIKLSKKVDKVEEKSISYAEKYIKKVYQSFKSCVSKEIPFEYSEIDFTDVIINNYYLSYSEGIKSVNKPKKFIIKMAKKKKSKITSESELKKMIDQMKKNPKKYLTPQQKKEIKDLDALYRDKLKDVYKDYIRKDMTTEEMVKDLEKSAGVVSSRAKMIVRTETNNYYNQARKTVYDEDEFVTHYQFLSIRDHRTTDWCNDRHSLIYKKGNAVTDKETPPIHWNCRSIFSPLDIFNDEDIALINNKSLKRENNSPKPLPKGWNKK